MKNENAKLLAAAAAKLQKLDANLMPLRRAASALQKLDDARDKFIAVTEHLKKAPHLGTSRGSLIPLRRAASALQKLDDARDKFIAVAEDLKKAPELGMKIKRPGSKAPHKRGAPRPV